MQVKSTAETKTKDVHKNGIRPLYKFFMYILVKTTILGRQNGERFAAKERRLTSSIDAGGVKVVLEVLIEQGVQDFQPHQVPQKFSRPVLSNEAQSA